MVDVVGVHGISQQQGGPTQLRRAWKDALVDGLVAARGKPAGAPAPSMDIGYYGNLFLQDWPTNAIGTSAAKGTPGDGGGSGSESAEDEEWFAEIADELPVEEVPPSKGPRPVQRLAAWIDATFGAAAPALFFGDLRQVRRYQHDDDLAKKVQ